tara:strand:+ start:15345 stop:16268 length:924 start_codon:yes stop_codon:yes gene_type:complete
MIKNNIVILGANSFIANNFIKDYKDYSIKATTRKIKQHQYNNKNLSWHVCDLENKKEVLNILNKGDIVINCAYSNDGISTNIKIIKNIVECANKKNINKLIHLSSAVVVGVQVDKNIDENVICNPQTQYQKDKLDIETFLLKSDLNFNLIMLRPTAVFGMGGKNLVKNINSIKKNKPFIDMIKIFILGNRQMHLVTVENVNRTIDFFIKRYSEVQKEIFFISQDNDPFNNYSDVYSELNKSINKTDYSHIGRHAISKHILILLFKVLRKRHEEVFCFYSSKKLKSIGLHFDIDLKKSIQSYVSQKQV